MLTSTKNKVIAVIIVAIIAILGYVVYATKTNDLVKGVGGQLIEDYMPYFRNNGGLATALPVKIGTSGSEISKLIAGTCTLIGTDVSQPASTTLPYDCAVTGVVSTDNAFAWIATSTSRYSGGTGTASWAITGAKASTTPGYITVMLFNNGSAAVPSVSSVGSTTPYVVIK